MLVQVHASGSLSLFFWEADGSSTVGHPALFQVGDNLGSEKQFIWEVILTRAQPRGEAQAYFRHTVTGKYLSSDGTDVGTMTVETIATDRALFTLIEQTPGEKKYFIRTKGGRYLRFESDINYRGSVTADANDSAQASIWELTLEPYVYEGVEIGFTESLELVWNDRGSGATMDAAFWRPKPTEPGFISLGDLCFTNYKDYSERGKIAVVVRDVSKSTERKTLASPTRFDAVWNDKGSGVHGDVFVWRPVPPTGYTALGLVTTNTRQQPAVSSVACVRSDLVARGTIDECIWNDAKSGSDVDFSAWSVAPTAASPGQIRLPPGTFVGVASHEKPDDDDCAAVLRLSEVEFNPAGEPEPPEPTTHDVAVLAVGGLLESPVIYTFYVPWCAVTDPEYTPAERMIKSPTYRLQRSDRYECVSKLDNRQSTVPQSSSQTVTEGIEKGTTNTFNASTGISVSLEKEVGVKPAGVGASAKITATWTAEFGYSREWSRTESESNSHTVNLTVPPGKVSAVFLVQSTTELFRLDGTRVGQTVTARKANSYKYIEI